MSRIKHILSNNVELIKRTISSLVLAPVFVVSIYLGGVWFDSVIALVYILSLREWLRLMSAPKLVQRNEMAKKLVLYMSGFAYITLACASFVVLNHSSASTSNAFYLLGLLCLIVWATDIGAYFSGRLLKGPKLWVRVSPNKTWAGFLGGIGFALITTEIALRWIADSIIFNGIAPMDLRLFCHFQRMWVTSLNPR
jgi:phosphatidate cytidylyltransferase